MLPIKVSWLCGGKTADINPEQPMKFNFNEAQEKIKKHHFKVRLKSQMVVIFDYGKMEISLFNGGRMLMKNVADEKSTLRAYLEILQALNLSFKQ